jgi:hypothetical protein
MPTVFRRPGGALFGAMAEDDPKVEAERRLGRTHFVAYVVDHPCPEKSAEFRRERERLRAERN